MVGVVVRRNTVVCVTQVELSTRIRAARAEVCHKNIGKEGARYECSRSKHKWGRFFGPGLVVVGKRGLAGFPSGRGVHHRLA